MNENENEIAFPETVEQQMMFGSIMMELMRSERFVQFLNMNFDIQTAQDPEAKEIMIRVIEVPPEEVVKRIKELAGAETVQEPQPEVKPKKAGTKLIQPPNTTPSKIVENKMKNKIIGKAVKMASEDKKIIL